MEELYQDDMLVQATPTSPFQYKKYLDENAGVKLQDVWTDVGGARGREFTGWPTQKPMALMQRIIAASSDPGDAVLDPFAGCATTLVACENMGAGQRRAWVGIDRAAMAKVHVLNRLLDTDIDKAAVPVAKIDANDDEGIYDDALFQRALNQNSWAMTLHTEPPIRTDDGQIAPGFTTPRRPTTRPSTTFSYDEMMQLCFDRWLYQCAGCGKQAPKFPNGNFDTGDFQLDHITPRDLNDPDTDELDNRCVLCARCNRKKSNVYTLTGLQRQNIRDGETYVDTRQGFAAGEGRSSVGPGHCPSKDFRNHSAKRADMTGRLSLTRPSPAAAIRRAAGVRRRGQPPG